MRARALVVVAVALLAMTAMPASAQNASAIASKHTTFGTSGGEPAPTQTTNMSIVGSGDSASVALGTTATYNPATDEGDGAEASGRIFIGDLSVDSIVSSELKIQPQSDGEITTLTPNITGTRGSDYGFVVDIYIVNSDIDQSYGDGTLVKDNWNPDFATGDQQIAIDPYQVSAGQTYTVEFVTQSSDNDGTKDTIRIAPDTSASSAWRSNTFLGTDDEYADLGVTIEASPSSGTYVGATHGAEKITQAWTNLTLSNASADITWQEDGDGDGAWTNVTSTTVSTTSNVTTGLPATKSDRWRVRVDFTTTGSNPVAKLHDEGVLFDPASPTLSDPEPPDEEKIANAVGNVSINVSDGDFSLAQGDSVTVSATDDEGADLGSTTLTSNGTASLPYSSDNGENVIQWTATDEYGNTDTFTQTFNTPSTLLIRNESAPSQIVDTSSNVTVTFFGDGGQTIIERSSANGSIDLSGIPTDTEYIVQINADGYRSRQAIITSLYDQQNVYLLPDSATAATVEFQLNDQTGRFQSESTTLFVERPIRRNGTTEFRTVFADSFGATDSLRVDLKNQERYRLKVRNGENEVRVLESYTAAGDAVAPLTIGAVEVSGQISDRGVAFDSQIVETDQGDALRIVYRDPEQRTDSVEVSVRRNDSQYAPNISGDTTDGRLIATVPVDNSTPANATFNVSFAAVRGGETVTGSTQVGGVGELDVPVPALPLSLLSWTATLGLMSMVVIRSPRLAPATGTATASAFTVFGWLSIPAAALGIAGAISIFAVYGRGGGQ